MDANKDLVRSQFGRAAGECFPIVAGITQQVDRSLAEGADEGRRVRFFQRSGVHRRGKQGHRGQQSDDGHQAHAPSREAHRDSLTSAH